MKDGVEQELSGDIIISSMPLKDLVMGMNDVPENELRIAKGLPYRDYMTLGVLVKDIENTVWMGMEYFVQEGDEHWTMKDEDFAAFVVDEMIKVGLIDSAESVLDTRVERVKKAYPA